MLYPYHFLDYAMVGMALIALIYQLILVRPSLKKEICFTDVVVFLMGLIVFAHYLENPVGNHSVTMKLGSAFLLYFMGRIYHERLEECSPALVGSSYIVAYANLFHRLVFFHSNFWGLTDAKGDLFYNDTDLGFGLLIALIFIVMYARNGILKLVTVFFVIPVLLFNSCAGVQKILFIAIFVLLLIYVLEVMGVPRKAANGILLTGVLGLFALIVILMFPVFTGEINFLYSILEGRWISVATFSERIGEWDVIWNQIQEASLLRKLFGISLAGRPFNQYITILYTSGIVGVALSLIYLCGVLKNISSVKSRKIFYIWVLITILFLGSSILNNCMEFTQCSWFFMMYGGMVVSNSRKQETTS